MFHLIVAVSVNIKASTGCCEDSKGSENSDIPPVQSLFFDPGRCSSRCSSRRHTCALQWDIINCNDNSCRLLCPLVLIIVILLSACDMTLIGCGDSVYIVHSEGWQESTGPKRSHFVLYLVLNLLKEMCKFHLMTHGSITTVEFHLGEGSLASVSELGQVWNHLWFAPAKM